MDNNNPKPEIEKILRTCLENLRELAHTPSKPHSPDWKLVNQVSLLIKAQVLSGFVLCAKWARGFPAGILARWGQPTRLAQ